MSRVGSVIVRLSYAVLVVSLLALLACGNRPRRVLLVGIDSANLRVIAPLLARGRLPHLRTIADEGVHGPLRSHIPLWSPRIWNSVATGKNPKGHGILGFVWKDEGGVQHIYKSRDRKAHALWNILSDAGYSVAVVNWWNTYPPEKINGVMISDYAIPGEAQKRRKFYKAVDEKDVAPVVFPISWTEKLDAILSNEERVVEFQDPFQASILPSFVDREKLSQYFEEDARFVKLAMEIESQTRPDILMVFLPGIDRISHWLWGNLEPAELYPEKLRPSESERKGGAAALEAYYEYTDALIGRLLEPYGPDDLVLIVSDHGFEAGVEFGSLTGAHDTQKALHGVLFGRGPGITPGDRTVDEDGAPSVNDVTPTILGWLGLAPARDMDGSMMRFLELPSPLPASVASYDNTPIERLAGQASKAEEALIEGLRELGYVE